MVFRDHKSIVITNVFFLLNYDIFVPGLLLSVPFLLATFLIYAFIPDLRNLHGMCLMAYCGGLIVAYPFLAYLKLHVGRVGVAMTGCLVVGESNVLMCLKLFFYIYLL